MRRSNRRSTSVTLTFLSSVAASVLAACGGSRARHCVDDQTRVVPDSLCATRPRSGGGAVVGWYPYRYYYGGAGYRGLGSVLRGGSYSAPRSGGGAVGGAHVGGGTARGGFGGIGGGHAGG
ncbi:MAG: hypothetical protein JO180_07960 [Gemmatirosa sp.]|nr:hypothetical protein [Gemmatirosa sp.]